MRTVLLVTMAVAAGCGVHRFEARATQPNPARNLGNPEVLPASETLYIHQRDMDLPRDFQLRSWAQFAVVTRDRIRFHVGIARQDEDEADTRHWKVTVEDETGHIYEPEREVARINRLALNWRLWPYKPGDSWCPHPPCVSRVLPGYEAWEGQADYTIRQADLVAPRKKLSLVLRKRGEEMRFTWSFGEETVVEHYGRSHTDDQLGTIVVPGPFTEVAGTHYEHERW